MSKEITSDRLAVSIEEAARLLSIGRSSVYNAIGAGELHASKIGRRTVITLQEVKRFLAALPAAKDAA